MISTAQLFVLKTYKTVAVRSHFRIRSHFFGNPVRIGKYIRYEDRDDHDVDIFIIQKVQDPVIHLNVDEEQWKITQGSKRQVKWIWSPRAISGLRLPDRYSSCTKSKPRSTPLDRKQNNGGVSAGQC